MLYGIGLACIYHISSLHGHIHCLGNVPEFLNGANCADMQELCEILASYLSTCFFSEMKPSIQKKKAGGRRSV